MSNKAGKTAQAGNKTEVNAAAVANFLKTYNGQRVIMENPPPPDAGPTEYIIVGVHEKKTVGLSQQNGSGKFNMILVKKPGAGDDVEPMTLNPNVVLDLAAGREAKGFTLASSTPESGTETTTETTAAPIEGDKGAEVAAKTEPDPAAVQAAAEKKAAADKKKADKEAAAAKRAADKKTKDEREAKEKAEREARKADKALSSGKIKALRIYRGEPATVPEGTTHRSRVMAKFRAPISEGGLGMSTQHANTYYQNCKGQWATAVLPAETAGE